MPCTWPLHALTTRHVLLVVQTGSDLAALDCPASSYCPTPAEEYVCPAGYYCQAGSLQPLTCNITDLLDDNANVTYTRVRQAECSITDCE